MYIIWIGYLFVVIMFSAAQPSIVRVVFFLIFLAVIPTIVMAWILRTKRRNQISKWQQVLADRERKAQEVQQNELEK